jgi:uncharacterized membrane protein YbhN (UPF0104 family)
MKNKRYLIIVNFLVIAIALIFVSKTFRLEGKLFLSAIAKFQPIYWLAALTAALMQTFFQINRLWVLFPKDARLPWIKTARAISYGQFLNTFGPTGAGDVLKVVLTRKHKDKNGRQLDATESSAIVFVVDKVADLGSLLLLMAIALLQGSLNLPALNFGDRLKTILIGTAFLILLFYIIFFIFRSRSGAIARWLSGFRAGLRALQEPKRLSKALLMGLGNNLAKLIALYVLCIAQGFFLSFPELLVAILILNLGISVPISPANLGVYEAALTFALTSFGIPTTEGLAIATVHHVCQMIEIAILALGFWLYERWQDWRRQSITPKKSSVRLKRDELL